jgi:hypothetical protein
MDVHGQDCAITLNAHRLWINVWTALPSRRITALDWGVTGGCPAVVVNVSTAAPADCQDHAQRSVHSGSGACLRRCEVSTESTGPTTTTSFSLSSIQEQSRLADGQAVPLTAARPDEEREFWSRPARVVAAQLVATTRTWRTDLLRGDRTGPAQGLRSHPYIGVRMFVKAREPRHMYRCRPLPRNPGQRIPARPEGRGFLRRSW